MKRTPTPAASANWRSERIEPKLLKLFGRVLYRQIDIEAYEESCVATSTKVVPTQVSANDADAVDELADDLHGGLVLLRH